MSPRTFAVVGTGVGVTVLVAAGITYASALGSTPASPAVHHAARPHPLVLMLERERRHLAQVAIECERLRIEVRMTTAAEQQAAQLKRILDLALAQAGFSAEEQRRVVTALPNVIRQLSAVPDA